MTEKLYEVLSENPRGRQTRRDVLSGWMFIRKAAGLLRRCAILPNELSGE